MRADYEVDIETDSEFSFRSEGTTRPTGLGVAGGSDGQIGQASVTELGKETCNSPVYGLMRVGPARLEVHSPGGGGVGDPLAREVAKVVRDVRDGLVSVGMARDAYGVVMKPDLRSADVMATTELRGSKQTSHVSITGSAPGRRA